MKSKIEAANLIKELLKVHRRFLELERLDAEKYFDKKLAPLEFFNMLTQNANFEWLRPFSKMIAEVDAFSEEMEMTPKNKTHMVIEIKKVLELPKIQRRCETHQSNDSEFMKLYNDFTKTLERFEN